MSIASRGDEARRLAALSKCSLLDTQPEQAYDDIAALARLVCDVPIVLISLIDEKRQWFKAQIGLAFSEISRADSFCTHSIDRPDALLVIEDAAGDPRFADNPLVRGAPHIRFYAGAPLVDSDGMVLGTLCVIDVCVRTLNVAQHDALRALAYQVVAQIEMAGKSRQLEDAEIRFAAFMDCSPAVGFIKDEHGRYLYVNQAFVRRCCMSISDVVGKRDTEIWPEDVAHRLRAHDAEVRRTGQAVTVVEIMPNNDGSKSFWQTNRFPLSENGLLGGVAFDISELKRHEAQLETCQNELMRHRHELREKVAQLEVLSTTDSLTGLKNRRAFEAIIDTEWSYALRCGTPLSLLMLDLDHFKRINDTLGHDSGDKLLQAVGRILRQYNRTADLAARFGGEEFIVLLPHTDEEDARVFAERLREEIAHLQSATVSIGVATKNACADQPAALIRAADQALYHAKQSGRNRVCVASASPRQGQPGNMLTDGSDQDFRFNALSMSLDWFAALRVMHTYSVCITCWSTLALLKSMNPVSRNDAGRRQ